MRRMFIAFVIAVLALAALPVSSTFAQDAAPPMPTPAANPAPPPAESPAPAADAQGGPVAAIPPGDINPNEIMPVVLSYWEHAAIQDARASIGSNVRPPDFSDFGKGNNKVKPPPEEREIALQGILFYSPDDWTIWLNGKRVTPKALPKETLDLKVYKEYVEMKWFDDYTNQIFPIRLRAHQRFNIDSRIFLPG